LSSIFILWEYELYLLLMQDFTKWYCSRTGYPNMLRYYSGNSEND